MRDLRWALLLVGLAFATLLWAPRSYALTTLGQQPVVSVTPTGASLSWADGRPSTFVGRNFATQGSGVKQSIPVQWRVGAHTMQGTASRIFTKAALATAVRGALIGGGVGIAATVLPVLWDQVLEPYGVAGDFMGRPVVDPGQAQQLQGGAVTYFRNGQPTPIQTVANLELAIGSQQCASSSGNGYTCVVSGPAQGSCSGGVCQYSYQVQLRAPNGDVSSTWGANSQNIPEIQAYVCPQTSLAPLDIRWTSTGGTGAPCPSDNRVPAPPAIVEQAVQQAAPEAVRAAVEELDAAPAGSGNVDVLRRMLAAEPQSEALSGPASLTVPGTSTTSGPSGTSIDDVSIACNYGGTSAWCTTTTTTTVTDPQGGTTTTTRTDTTAPGAEVPTQCDKYPDSLGCQVVGDVPTVELPAPVPAPIPQRRDFGASSGACPPPPTISVGGASVAMDNTVLCQWLSMLRPIILAFSGLVSAGIFAGGVRR